MKNRYPMTVEGEKKLRAELQQLRNIERPRLSEAIAEARSHGDLKENAEYHSAREQQGFVEARIRDIEAKLAGAQVIDVAKIKPTGKVIFGTTVQIIDQESSKKVIYQIVGEDEADIKQGKLSVSSPLSRALVGKEVGDIVEIEVRDSALSYEICSIKHL